MQGVTQNIVNKANRIQLTLGLGRATAFCSYHYSSLLTVFNRWFSAPFTNPIIGFTNRIILFTDGITSFTVCISSFMNGISSFTNGITAFTNGISAFANGIRAYTNDIRAFIVINKGVS